MNRKKLLISLLVPLCGGLLGYLAAQILLTEPTASPDPHAAHDHSASDYYTCPMHPSVREAGPGQCPICSMDLIRVRAEERAAGTIKVDARRRQLIGLELATAQREPMVRTLRSVGEIAVDQSRQRSISLKYDVWIGELHADHVGAPVTAGQPLFTVYSPELVSAQQEYLQARRAGGPLLAAARQRLLLWNIAEQDVARLARSGVPQDYLPIRAPIDGVVLDIAVRAGGARSRGEVLLTLADLSTVWVEAQVYEADLPLLREGMEATVGLPYAGPGTRQATVAYIYPTLDAASRTGRMRIVLDNPDGQLRPAMFARVDTDVDLGPRLQVPDTAVVIAGDKRVVFVDEGEGRLRPQRVRTGQRADGRVEILEGLSAGDRVVAAGTFLIAAEARLKTGIEQW